MKEAEKIETDLTTETRAVQSEQELAADRQFAREGEIFEIDTVETKVSQLQQIAGQSILEIGRLLCWTKARVGHGEFIKSLKRIGIGYATANAYMKLYEKLGKKPNIEPVQYLGISKALELVRNYEEEELQALASGKEVDGHTLDEFSQMNRAELKATLKRERESSKKETEAIRKQADTLQKRNSQLAQQIENGESGADGGWEYTAQRLTQMRELCMWINKDAMLLQQMAETWAESVESGDPKALAGHPFILADLNYMRNLMFSSMEICTEALDRAHAADHPELVIPEGIRNLALGFSRLNLPKSMEFTQTAIEDADRNDS